MKAKHLTIICKRFISTWKLPATRRQIQNPTRETNRETLNVFSSALKHLALKKRRQKLDNKFSSVYCSTYLWISLDNYK